MIDKVCSGFAAPLALVMGGTWATLASAQIAEIKEKPPMYTYVSNWAIPRAQWPELDKMLADTNKVFAAGSLI